MANIATFDTRLKAAHIGIHRAIHSPEVIALQDGGTNYPVRKAPNGCRFIDYEGTVFMEQNKNKTNAYAAAARAGKHITWGIQHGSWIYIDDEIADAFEKRNQKALADLVTT